MGLSKRLVPGIVALALTIPIAGVSAASTAHAESTSSAISTAQFSDPSIQYRPGVRWWWSGGAVETKVLGEQLEYLAANGFGYVEINPFGKELPADDPNVKDIYTDTFYEKLEWAVAKAEKLGITVDLNMGTAWNANSQYVTIDESQGNIALGRATLTGTEVKAGAIAIPALSKSRHYGTSMPKFDPTRSRLQGVLVAERTGVIGTVTGDAASFDDGATTWDQRVSLNVNNSFYVDASDLAGSTVTLGSEALAKIDDAKEYEVVSVYFIPAGSGGVADAARPDWFVVDHMNAKKTLQYVNQWVGDANLDRIISRHKNVRALFNDSLELNSDLYYNEELYELAKDAEGNGIGYDFSKYLPTVYRQNLNAPAYRGPTMAGSTNSYLTYTADTAEHTRILADFQQLVWQQFRDGLKGFKRGTNAAGLLFRQQAYNPPMDMIGAAKYVDIPEEEQGDEYRMITAASGAHLYGRNLVTMEQWTLGSTPLQNSLETVKVGIDMMATGGANNYFYHGLSYPYGKNIQDPHGSKYGENGWSPFATIGINVSEDNTLSKHFRQLNTYAARLNYLMQQGKASKDVAVYAPFNTRAVNTGATPTLNSNGYAWDVINDESLQASNTVVKNGRISVNGGNMEYQALIVHTSTVPVKTMQSLLRLAEEGAPIIFYGTLPNAQAGYADGNYVKENRKVAKLADEILLESKTVYHKTNPSALLSTLKKVVDPSITYDANDNIRFNRRALSDGGEVVFIRSTSTEPNTVTMRASNKYRNFYWLDQNDGRIYPADVKNGAITFTLAAGTDTFGRGSTTAAPSMGIVLLAEPAGVTIPQSKLSDGEPATVNRVDADEVIEVTPTSLTVTADNLDGVIGGAVATETFTSDILGNWKDASYQGGALQSVVADGIYRANLTVTPKADHRYVLNLGTVYTAASVKVNGKPAGSVIFTPYEVDVTEYLVAGDNAIEIAVTPRKKNRYYPAATNSSGQYSMASPQDAGLVGPITVQVEDNSVPVTGVTIAPVTASIVERESVQLSATVAPANATTTAVSWTSDKPKIATVDSDGIVTGLRPGTARITVTTADGGRSASVKVTVTKSTFRLNATSAKLQVGKSTKAIKPLGLDNGDRIVGWASSNPKIATVDAKGKITAKKKAGKVSITATTKRGATASVKITVVKGKVKTTSIKANVTKITLKRGESFQLEITRKPITATEKISYKSSKTTVAKVNSSGRITAKKKGTATITVKTSNKKSVKVKVTVR